MGNNPRMIITKNPATEQSIAEYPVMDHSRINDIIEQSNEAFLEWQKSDFFTRARLIKTCALILRRDQNHLAEIITDEMGKPIRESLSEIQKCAWVCDYYAENAERFLKIETIPTDADLSYVAFEPLGVILAIMPWNFPFWQVFRFIAPAIMAGNSVLLKHASNVTGCSLCIERLLCEAGFPPTLFRSLIIPNMEIPAILEHPLVRGVTLTGSTPAGKSVAELAGRHIKKCVLELGGSDPYIILEDADLPRAAEICANSRLLNNGQSCIAAKRFIVIRSIGEQFIEYFTNALQNLTIGDPRKETTAIGPLARADLREEIHRQVLESIHQGAECRCGGVIPDGIGYYYPPTLLTNVCKGMPAYSEELFGPVASIILADDDEHAIHVANDSEFGLGASVFTRNLQHGRTIAEHRLHAGSCFVNAAVKSDPRLPFGGIKMSGMGRELSEFGIREFVNIKTVYINNF